LATYIISQIVGLFLHQELFKKSFPDIIICYGLHVDFLLRLVCSNCEMVQPFKVHDMMMMMMMMIAYHSLVLVLVLLAGAMVFKKPTVSSF